MYILLRSQPAIVISNLYSALRDRLTSRESILALFNKNENKNKVTRNFNCGMIGHESKFYSDRLRSNKYFKCNNYGHQTRI